MTRRLCRECKHHPDLHQPEYGCEHRVGTVDQYCGCREEPDLGPLPRTRAELRSLVESVRADERERILGGPA